MSYIRISRAYFRNSRFEPHYEKDEKKYEWQLTLFRKIIYLSFIEENIYSADKIVVSI